MIDVIDTVVTEIIFNVTSISIKNANSILPLLKRAALESELNIELNFTNVQFIDSSAINMLVKLSQHMVKTKRTITLTNVSPDIHRVFELVRLSRFFKLNKNSPPIA